MGRTAATDRGSNGPSAEAGRAAAGTAATPQAADAPAEERATFHDLFRHREWAALYFGFVFSLLGDQLARVAISVLVFQRTGSALLTGVSYAISYAPWVIGGPLLSSYADRLPRRTVMIACDLARAILIGLLVIPGVPLAALLVILLVAGTAAPPFESARSATWADILEGDAYILGNATVSTTTQLTNVFGFLLGGTLVVALSARWALSVDAGTFLVSAIILTFFVRHRPPIRRPGAEAVSLWHDTKEGFRLIFGDERLRAVVLLVWLAPMFIFAWEGIAAPWAAELAGNHRGTGRLVGALLAAAALGAFVAGVAMGRLIAPPLRRRLMLPVALLGPVALLPMYVVHYVPLTLVLLVLAGAGTSFIVPLNGVFVQSVPPELRGRAFGVVSSGLQVAQGLGVLIGGIFADLLAPSTVVSLSGAVGIIVVGGVVLRHGRQVTAPPTRANPTPEPA